MDFTPPQSLSPAPLNYLAEAKEADEATNLEDSASDKENFAAEKVTVVAKGEAAKASNTGTNLESSSVISATTETTVKRG